MEINLSEDALPWERIGFDIVTQNSTQSTLVGRTKLCFEKINNIEGTDQLVKVFNFDNYLQALDFAKSVAMLAEEEDHHPKIVLEWGRVEVHWWSHKLKGLHKNDFICAAKTDSLA